MNLNNPDDLRVIIREEVKVAVSDSIQEVLPPLMRFFATKNDLQTFRNDIVKDFDATIETIKQGFDEDLRFLVRHARQTTRHTKDMSDRLNDFSVSLAELEERVKVLESKVS